MTIELEIRDRLIKAALNDGYSISVNDGEETTVVKSTDTDEIAAATRSTDEDYLIFFNSHGIKAGWVWLIWGNGRDLISDASDNRATSALIDPIIEWTNQW